MLKSLDFTFTCSVLQPRAQPYVMWVIAEWHISREEQGMPIETEVYFLLCLNKSKHGRHDSELQWAKISAHSDVLSDLAMPSNSANMWCSIAIRLPSPSPLPEDRGPRRANMLPVSRSILMKPACDLII